MTEKYEFTSLTKDDISLSPLALGGLTHGASPYEMNAAYAAIANGGEYVRPVFYSKVVDRNGNVLLDNTNPEKTRVIKETTAYLLTDAMRDVVTEGTGTAANTNDGISVAGKTGTTSDSHDLWFVGYTPYLTAGIWLGYDQNYEMEGDLLENEHSALWASIMRRINELCGYESASFEMPEGIGTRTVCSKSGKLVGTSHCSGVTEYFDLDALPSRYCTDHYVATICSVCGKLAGENTLEEHKESKEFDFSSEIPKDSCDCEALKVMICKDCGKLATEHSQTTEEMIFTKKADVPTSACQCQRETSAPESGGSTPPATEPSQPETSAPESGGSSSPVPVG